MTALQRALLQVASRHPDGDLPALGPACGAPVKALLDLGYIRQVPRAFASPWGPAYQITALGRSALAAGLPPNPTRPKETP